MKHASWKQLLMFVLVLGAFVNAPALISAVNQHPTAPGPPQPKPSPNAPTSQNAPQGLEGVPASSSKQAQSLNPQNEQEIRMQVQRLYAMATELKDEVDRTDENAVLSVAVVKRAQEIEKLAKQIKDKAKH